MSKFALLASGGGATAAAAVGVAVATGLIDLSALRGAPDAPAVAVVETAQPAPEADQPKVEVAVAPTPDPVDEPALAVLPSFSLVRQETDGLTMVAGAGLPSAELDLLVDGVVSESTMIGTDGQFAMFVDLPPSDQGRVLTLAMRSDAGDVTSDDEVLIAPVVAAVAPVEEPPAVEVAETASEDTQVVEVAEVEQAPEEVAEPEQVASLDTPTVEPERIAPEVVVADVAEPAAPAPDMAVADVAAEPVAPVVEEAPAPQVVAAAPAPAPAILSNASGVEVLPTAPIAPGDVALDSISYDGDGDVLLAGRGEDTAFVRVYLDNAPITTSRIAANGTWRVALPEVDTGTYTLRVDQIDEGGAVLARVESPFLREDPEVLTDATTGAGPIQSVTVQPGSTLWAIARERYGEGVAYVKVFEANKDRIGNPNLIYPGQIFDLPTQ